MPIVPAKCTQCGASIEVDNQKEAAICQHCGTAFIVEKAINNYNVTNNVVNNISADVINVVAGNIQDYIKNAQAAFEFEDYEKLEEMSNKILNLDPKNLDGIFYTVIVLTYKLKDIHGSVSETELVIKCINYIKALTASNYEVEKFMPYAKTIFHIIFYNYFDYKNEHIENLYPKIISLCKTLKIDVLTSFGCKNLLFGVGLETHYVSLDNCSNYMIKYLSENYPDFNNLLNDDMLLNKKRFFDDSEIKATSNFIYLHERKVNYDSDYVSYKNAIFYKENIIVEMIYNGYCVYVKVKDKYTKKLVVEEKIYLGEIKLLGGDKKIIKNAYNKLINNNFEVEITGDNEKLKNKLKSILES